MTDQLISNFKLTEEQCAQWESDGYLIVRGLFDSHQVEQLKQTMGPFVLAYLESLMRAADIRISRQPHDKPDALVSMEGVHA